jgi:hypothetical protein
VGAFYKMNKGDKNRNLESQFFVESQGEDRQDMTNNFLHTEPDLQQINDLQETRFIK